MAKKRTKAAQDNAGLNVDGMGMLGGQNAVQQSPVPGLPGVGNAPTHLGPMSKNFPYAGAASLGASAGAGNEGPQNPYASSANISGAGLEDVQASINQLNQNNQMAFPAVNKYAAQDNSKDQRSSTGEDNGVSFTTRDEDHATGPAAWESLSKFMKTGQEVPALPDWLSKNLQYLGRDVTQLQQPPLGPILPTSKDLGQGLASTMSDIFKRFKKPPQELPAIFQNQPGSNKPFFEDVGEFIGGVGGLLPTSKDLGEGLGMTVGNIFKKGGMDKYVKTGQELPLMKEPDSGQVTEPWNPSMFNPAGYGSSLGRAKAEELQRQRYELKRKTDQLPPGIPGEPRNETGTFIQGQLQGQQPSPHPRNFGPGYNQAERRFGLRGLIPEPQNPKSIQGGSVTAPNAGDFLPESGTGGSIQGGSVTAPGAGSFLPDTTEKGSIDKYVKTGGAFSQALSSTWPMAVGGLAGVGLPYLLDNNPSQGTVFGSAAAGTALGGLASHLKTRSGAKKQRKQLKSKKQEELTEQERRDLDVLDDLAAPAKKKDEKEDKEEKEGMDKYVKTGNMLTDGSLIGKGALYGGGAGGVLGGGFGALAGGMHGLALPGDDEEGEQRSRLREAFKRSLLFGSVGMLGGGLGGAALGAGLGGAATLGGRFLAEEGPELASNAMDTVAGEVGDRVKEDATGEGGLLQQLLQSFSGEASDSTDLDSYNAARDMDNHEAMQDLDAKVEALEHQGVDKYAKTEEKKEHPKDRELFSTTPDGKKIYRQNLRWEYIDEHGTEREHADFVDEDGNKADPFGVGTQIADSVMDKYGKSEQPADQTPRHDCHGVHPNQTHEEWKASLEKDAFSKYAMQPADQSPRHDCNAVHPDTTHEDWVREEFDNPPTRDWEREKGGSDGWWSGAAAIASVRIPQDAVELLKEAGYAPFPCAFFGGLINSGISRELFPVALEKAAGLVGDEFVRDLRRVDISELLEKVAQRNWFKWLQKTPPIKPISPKIEAKLSPTDPKYVDSAQSGKRYPKLEPGEKGLPGYSTGPMEGATSRTLGADPKTSPIGRHVGGKGSDIQLATPVAKPAVKPVPQPEPTGLKRRRGETRPQFEVRENKFRENEATFQRTGIHPATGVKNQSIIDRNAQQAAAPLREEVMTDMGFRRGVKDEAADAASRQQRLDDAQQKLDEPVPVPETSVKQTLEDAQRATAAVQESASKLDPAKDPTPQVGAVEPEVKPTVERGGVGDEAAGRPLISEEVAEQVGAVKDPTPQVEAVKDPSQQTADQLDLFDRGPTQPGSAAQRAIDDVTGPPKPRDEQLELFPDEPGLTQKELDDLFVPDEPRPIQTHRGTGGDELPDVREPLNGNLGLDPDVEAVGGGPARVPQTPVPEVTPPRTALQKFGPAAATGSLGLGGGIVADNVLDFFGGGMDPQAMVEKAFNDPDTRDAMIRGLFPPIENADGTFSPNPMGELFDMDPNSPEAKNIQILIKGGPIGLAKAMMEDPETKAQLSTLMKDQMGAGGFALLGEMGGMLNEFTSMIGMDSMLDMFMGEGAAANMNPLLKLLMIAGGILGIGGAIGGNATAGMAGVAMFILPMVFGKLFGGAELANQNAPGADGDGSESATASTRPSEQGQDFPRQGTADWKQQFIAADSLDDIINDGTDRTWHQWGEDNGISPEVLRESFDSTRTQEADAGEAEAGEEETAPTKPVTEAETPVVPPVVPTEPATAPMVGSAPLDANELTPAMIP